MKERNEKKEKCERGGGGGEEEGGGGADGDIAETISVSMEESGRIDRVGDG